MSGDDTIFGYPRRGRQSYFDDPCYERFNAQGRVIEDDPIPMTDPCHVKRAGLINAIATGRHTIVLGGLLGKERKPAPYSAGGPATTPADGTPNPLRPDALVVSDDSKVHGGVLGAGSHSGSRVAMNGTSVAAPQIARRVAQDLEEGGDGDRAFIQGLADGTNTNERWGNGRVNLNIPPMSEPPFDKRRIWK